MRARLLVGGLTSSIAAITVLCLPGLSIGGPLSDPGGGSAQDLTVQPSTPRAATPPPAAGFQPRQAVPGNTPYVPPLHGDNPHGQGTVGTIDLAPSAQRPLAGDPDGGDAPNQEEIVVGRSRGEQRADGTYHGHITVLALFGNEVIGVDTNPGETRNSPLQPIQEVLDALCQGGTGPVCLTVLRADSATTATSSTNSFALADLRAGSGGASLAATAAESNGNIASDGTCQTARGDSRVAGLTIGGGAGTLPQIDAVTSSSDSRACRGQAPTQTNTSDVIDPDIGVDPILPAGCGAGGPNGSGTPNTPGGITLLNVLPLVCNADDTNGTQASAPYGVREALSVFALVVPATDTALAKITAGASESRTIAPAAPAAVPPTPTPPTPPPGDGGGGGDDDDGGNADDGGGDDDGGDAGNRGAGGGGGGGDGGDGDGGGAAQCEDGIDNDGDGKVDFPNDPQCESRSDDSEANALAFTGVDLLTISLAGALMLAAGLGLRKRATGGRELV